MARIAPAAPNTPDAANPIIMPAKTTPAIIAITLFLKSISNKLAAKVPVQAPVPGSGIPTNKNKAQYKPRPAFSCNSFHLFHLFLNRI